jgi:hypothetical protein
VSRLRLDRGAQVFELWYGKDRFARRLRLLFEENGRLRALDTLDHDIAASIASVEVFEEYQGRGEER